MTPRFPIVGSRSLATLVLAALLVAAALPTRSEPTPEPPAVTPPAAAQEASRDNWRWPEKPQNLQVFPADMPGFRLQAPMRGFAGALGVGCDHCHVGEAGAPLSTFDFASDDNPNKDRAREMLRMLGSITDHLRKIEPSAQPPVNMWCHTCHRGRPRPFTLRDELELAMRDGGVEAAFERHEALRAEHYGRGRLDFGDEGTLNQLGYQLLGEDPAAAVRIFTANAEHFPDSANVWDSLAEGYRKAGDEARAVEFYEKSLELDPGNLNAKMALQELEGR